VIGELLCLAWKLEAIDVPSSRDYYRSVRNWFENEQPFVEDEFYHQYKDEPSRENV